MSAIKSDFSIQSYLERSGLVREIQTECARAERGEQVDLKQTAEKLSGLVQKLNGDIRAINLAPKMSLNVRQAYDLHRAELKGLTARVNSLAAKTNGMPAWVKPVVSTAFGLAGVAATAFILYKSGVFSSLTPPDPTPASSPISRSTALIPISTASTSSSSFVPPLDSTVPSSAPVRLKNPSPVPVLNPLGQGASSEEYLSRGEALLAQLKYNPRESVFYGICPKILHTKTNLLSRETRYFYNKCIEQIPIALTAIENSIDRAFVASQIQSGCLSSARHAMKDRFVAEIILPFSHSAAHGMVDKDDFALLMGKYGNTSAIIAALQKEGSDIDWWPQGAEPIESYIDSIGKIVGDNPVGHAIARYPVTSPSVAVGFTGINLVLTHTLAMMSARETSGSLVWTLPPTFLSGYFTPHLIMSPPSLSDVGSLVKDVLFATPSQILNFMSFVDRQVEEAGQSLGKRWNEDSYIGHALQVYPRTTLTATGTASGTGIGILRRAYYVFKAAIEADLEAALKVIKPDGKLTKNQKRNFNYRKARASLKAFEAAVSTGTFAMASLYMIGGSALFGAVAVPVVAGGVYGLYSLYTYFDALVTNATQSEEKLLA